MILQSKLDISSQVIVVYLRLSSDKVLFNTIQYNSKSLLLGAIVLIGMKYEL